MRKLNKKYDLGIYIFYGNSRIGKTLFADAISKGLNEEFKVVHDTTKEDIIKELKLGHCVIIDDIKTKIEAEILARVLSDDGFKTVLVEFKAFA